MRVSLALLLVWISSLASGSRLPPKMDDAFVDGGFGDDMIMDLEDGPQEMNYAENDTIEVEESDMMSGEDNGPMEVQSVLQLNNITDRASDCVDMDPDCPKFAASNFCNSAIVMENCKYSCKLCQSEYLLNHTGHSMLPN